MKAVKYQKKSLIKLEDLLRRRKTNLKKFLLERGITTYRELGEICTRLGVVIPTVESFNKEVPDKVTTPGDGVVVVPPLTVIHESTGEREDLEDDFVPIPQEQSLEDAAPEPQEQENTNPLVAWGAELPVSRKRSKKNEVK